MVDECASWNWSCSGICDSPSPSPTFSLFGTVSRLGNMSAQCNAMGTYEVIEIEKEMTKIAA